MWNKAFVPASHCQQSVYIRRTDLLTPEENNSVLFPGGAKRWALVVSLMNHWDCLYKIRKYLPLEAQHIPNCEVRDNRCQFVQTEVTRNDLSARSILETLPHDIRERRDQSAYKKICLSCNVPTHYPMNRFRYLLRYVRNFSSLSEGVWWYTQTGLTILLSMYSYCCLCILIVVYVFL